MNPLSLSPNDVPYAFRTQIDNLLEYFLNFF